MSKAVCTVCDGRGFMKAAPLSVPPSYGPTGTLMIGRGHGQHRRVLWDRALVIPCWQCGKPPG